MRNRVKDRKRTPSGDRAGMSIIELLVAMVLLAVGLLGMAMLSIRLNKQHDGASTQQFAALVVQSRFDSLASIHCQTLAPSGPVSGSAVTRGIKEQWTIMDGNDIKMIVDTVSFAGRTNPLAYVSIIPCRD